jgi:hypothetical protein
MGKWLIVISDLFQNLTKKINGIISDKVESADGRLLSGVSRPKIKKIVKILTVVVVVSWAVVKSVQDDTKSSSGLEDFEGSAKTNFPVTTYEKFELKDKDDPILNTYVNDRKPLLRKRVNPYIKDCKVLLKKLKSGERLTVDEVKRYKDQDCSNLLSLSSKERKIVNSMLNGINLSDDEYALLAAGLNGELTDDDDPRSKILDGLLSSDKSRVKAAKELVNNIGNISPEMADELARFLDNKLSSKESADLKKWLNADDKKRSLLEAIKQAKDQGDLDAANLLSKLLNGGKLTPEELERLKEWLKENNPELYDKLFGGETPEADVSKKSEVSQDDIDRLTAELDAKNKKILEAALRKAAANERLNAEELKALRDALEKARKRAEEAEALIDQKQRELDNALKKLLEGLELSAAEKYAIDNNSDYKKKVDNMKADRDALETALKAAIAKLAGQEEENNKLKKQVAKLKKKTNLDSKVSYDDIVYDANGRKLTPVEISLIKNVRKKNSKRKIGSSRNNRNKNRGYGRLAGYKSNDPFYAGLGSRVKPGEEAFDISKVSARSGTEQVKGIDLTPDMVILGTLESEVRVSSKAQGGATRVTVKIIEDVISRVTNDIYVPKGAIAVGTVSGFDADTQIATISLDKVVIGGKVLPFNVTVGSGNGQSGLYGTVFDTQSKKFLGAWISAFTGGVFEAASEIIAAEYATENADLATAVTAAALNGGAEVSNQLATQLAAELQGAAKIFYVPRGVPIVMTPK